MAGLVDDVYPACMPDLNGLVHLRGHLSLSPVPATGGIMVGVLPMDYTGACSCSPIPDPGNFDNTIIVTTTAMAYPRDRPNVPDVCMVRVMISMYLPPDVNKDFVIDMQDVRLVEASPYYRMQLSSASVCPEVNGKNECGPVDVNKDGFVNMLDTTAITQSAAMGTNITCGGIYVTAFSCGSSRSAPLTPAVDISLDSITYYNNNGEYGVQTSLLNQQRRRNSNSDSSLMNSILVEVEHMQGRIRTVDDLEVSVQDISGKLGSQGAVLTTHEETLKDHSTRLALLRRALPTEQRDMIFVVSLALAAIVVCGALVHYVMRRR